MEKSSGAKENRAGRLRAGLKNDRERHTLGRNRTARRGELVRNLSLLCLGMAALAACASDEQAVRDGPDPVTVTVTTTSRPGVLWGTRNRRKPAGTVVIRRVESSLSTWLFGQRLKTVPNG